MRSFRALIIYLVVVFGGGALLAPWLYFAAQWAAQQAPAFHSLAQNPFYRFVLRSLLGLAVLGLWPLLASSKMTTARELGWTPVSAAPRKLFLGILIGLGSLALVAALSVFFQGRLASFSHSPADYEHFLLGAATAAILVAIIEEMIFRAALFGILRKTFPWPIALVFSSAIYASVHFLQKAPNPNPIGWLSGFQTLAAMFNIPADGLPPIPAFLTLLLAGSILALAYQRTGTLYLSIGLHAGWIFWLRAYRFFTQDAPHASRALWGSDKLLDGWMPFFIMAAVLALMLKFLRPRSNS